MKKNKIVSVLAILFIFATISLAGCGDSYNKKTRIDTPSSVYIDNTQSTKMLIIDEVENARGYTVRIDGSEQDTNTYFYDCTKILASPKRYSIEVKALAEDGYLDSYYSSMYYYSNIQKLSTPVVSLFETVLSWPQEITASGYTVNITLPDGSVASKDVVEGRFDFSSSLTMGGVYSFSVVAHSNNALQADSEPSASVNYTYVLQLSKPTNLSVQKVGADVFLTFVADLEADSHSVVIDGREFAVKTTSVNLSTLSGLILNQAKRYYIKVQSLGNLAQSYIASDVSDTAIYDNYVRLGTPVVNSLTDNGEDIVASWTPVAHASTYSVWVNGALYKEKVVATQLLIPKTQLVNNQINVSVVALAEGYYSSSFRSEETYYTAVKKLDTPYNLSISKVGQNIIATWNAIDNAGGYLVQIGKTELECNTNTLDITSSLINAGQYEVRVKALPVNGNGYVASAFCDVELFNFTKKLGTVEGITVFNNAEGYFVSFNANVPNASSYDLYILGTRMITNITKSPINITSYLTSAGAYNIAMKAIAIQPSYYTDGALSEAVKFDYRTKLESPVGLKVNKVGNTFTLTFAIVPGATNYNVTINNGTPFVTNSNSVNISEYIADARLYEIRVRANAGENAYYADSEYTKYNYSHVVELSIVSNLTAIIDANGQYVARWSSVPHATSYTMTIIYKDDVTVNNVVLRGIPGNNIDITEYLRRAGNYEIRVQTIGTGYYLSSTESALYSLTKQVTLDAPKINSVIKDANSLEVLVKFGTVENAKGYNVKINGKVVLENITGGSFDIGNIIREEGKYDISVQSIGSGNFNSSTYSVPMPYQYVMVNIKDFERYTAFMYGKNIDMYINSFEELKLAVWYNYLYRMDDYKIYVPKTMELQLVSAYETEYESLGEDQYKNTLNVSLNCLAKYNGNFAIAPKTNNGYEIPYVVYTNSDKNIINFRYVLLMEENHERSFDAEELAEKMGVTDLSEYEALLNNPNLPNNVINHPKQTIKYYTAQESGRAETFNDFEVEQRVGVNVGNTEQLIMAVTYGCKPIFTAGSDVAQRVYNNAKKVLRSIIRNDFSPLQKVAAIYDWLTIANVYDYESYYFSMAIKNASYVNMVGQYSPYFVEGVLYDLENPVAVCDGISQAFALLCNIEGIECIRATGVAGKPDNMGNHAWNKVKINNVWYIVDSTWGDEVLLAGDNDYLIAMHEYFLITEQPDHIEYWPKDPSKMANSPFDYYSSELAQFTADGKVYDRYIDDQAELNKLAQYTKSGEYHSGLFEYKFSDALMNKWKGWTDMDVTNEMSRMLETALRAAGDSLSTVTYSPYNRYTQIWYVIFNNKVVA